jgi:hypothetical protein
LVIQMEVDVMQEADPVDQVLVTWRDRERVFPGLRDGDVVAWVEPGADLQRVDGDEGHRMQRHFLLLDHGVKLTVPNPWIERGDPMWYVDLVIWEQTGDRFDVTDLDIDLVVPMDGRSYRTLDLDEFADAIEAGEFTLAQALDCLRRWQGFLDRHLHIFGPGSDMARGWRDFPPAAIAHLRALHDDAYPVREREKDHDRP